MTRQQYIDRMLTVYHPVSVLSRKNGCEVLRLRNKQNRQDLVLRSLPCSLAAYEKLQNIRFENLPEIYEVLELEDGQIVLEEYIDGITAAQVMESGKCDKNSLHFNKMLLKCHPWSTGNIKSVFPMRKLQSI